MSDDLDGFYARVIDESRCDSDGGSIQFAFCITDEVRNAGFYWFSTAEIRDKWEVDFNKSKSFEYEQVHWSGTLDDLMNSSDPFCVCHREEFFESIDQGEKEDIISDDLKPDFITFVDEYGS